MAWLQSLAALIPLDGLGRYIHWHFVYLSVSNFIVIIVMIATFLAALFLPFPGKNSRKESQ